MNKQPLPCTRDSVQMYSLPPALFRQAAQEHQFSPDPPGERVSTEKDSKEVCKME